MEENAKYFYYIEKQYNINGIFVASIGIHESNWGTSKISKDKKNLFGYGAYDTNPYNGAYNFSNYSESIDLIARVLVKYYLNPKGTIGLEILEEEPNIDTVLVPIGGGGILAGIATAVKSINPNIKVIGVESANAASMTEALSKGECCEVCSSATIADGIAVRKVGCKTLELAKKYVDEVITVTESEIANAVLFLLEKSKISRRKRKKWSIYRLACNKPCN